MVNNGTEALHGTFPLSWTICISHLKGWCLFLTEDETREFRCLVAVSNRLRSSPLDLLVDPGYASELPPRLPPRLLTSSTGFQRLLYYTCTAVQDPVVRPIHLRP
mmetsp:Transcript_28623/g.111859  ORF Transcript_28623/g.111859 Transcript_28623/m.111859 type:complete len:105 (-) Transcript_28623:30-344(-)